MKIVFDKRYLINTMFAVATALLIPEVAHSAASPKPGQQYTVTDPTILCWDREFEDCAYMERGATFTVVEERPYGVIIHTTHGGKQGQGIIPNEATLYPTIEITKPTVACPSYEELQTWREEATLCDMLIRGEVVQDLGPYTLDPSVRAIIAHVYGKPKRLLIEGEAQ